MTGLDLFLIEGITVIGFIGIAPKTARFIFSKLAVLCDCLVEKKQVKKQSKKVEPKQRSKVIEMPEFISTEEQEIIDTLKNMVHRQKAATKAAKIAVQENDLDFNEKLRKAFQQVKNA